MARRSRSSALGSVCSSPKSRSRASGFSLLSVSETAPMLSRRSDDSLESPAAVTEEESEFISADGADVEKAALMLLDSGRTRVVPDSGLVSCGGLVIGSTCASPLESRPAARLSSPIASARRIFASSSWRLPDRRGLRAMRFARPPRAGGDAGTWRAVCTRSPLPSRRPNSPVRGAGCVRGLDGTAWPRPEGAGPPRAGKSWAWPCAWRLPPGSASASWNVLRRPARDSASTHASVTSLLMPESTHLCTCFVLALSGMLMRNGQCPVRAALQLEMNVSGPSSFSLWFLPVHVSSR